MAPHQQRRIGLAVTALAIGAIAFLTLQPQPENADLAELTSLWCLVCGASGGQDVILNILLYLPFGLGLRLSGWSWRRSVLTAFLCSFTIETLQYTIVAGRDASLSDVLTNTLGGGLGAWLGGNWRTVLASAPRLSQRLAIGSGAAWVACLGLTAWLVSVSLPHTIYFGQWAAELAHFYHFEGEVRSAALEGIPLPSQNLTESDAVRTVLGRRRFTLRVDGVSGPPTEGPAPIFSMFDERTGKILVLAQDGRDLLFTLRMRAEEVRLRAPMLRIAQALPAVAGVPIELEAGMDSGHYFIRSQVAGQPYADRRVALSVGWGWALVVPVEHYGLGPAVYLLTGLWLGGLLLPAGYWAGRATGRAAVYGLALAIGFGLGLVPLLFGLPVPDPSAWAAALLGTLLGWGVGRAGLRLSRPGP